MRLGRENEFSKHLEAVFETATTSSHQDHYPERLGSAFFVNTPWLLHSFFTAASAFLDPVPWRFAPVSPQTWVTQGQWLDFGYSNVLENARSSSNCGLNLVRWHWPSSPLCLKMLGDRRIGLRICLMASSKRPLELPSNCAEGHIATQTSCYTTQQGKPNGPNNWTEPRPEAELCLGYATVPQEACKFKGPKQKNHLFDGFLMVCDRFMEMTWWCFGEGNRGDIPDYGAALWPVCPRELLRGLWPSGNQALHTLTLTHTSSTCRAITRILGSAC